METKKKGPGGRPRAIIDWETVDKLCMLHCTQVEIASVIDISVDTLDKAVKREKGMGFTEYFKIKSAKGKISLRRKQYDIADRGDKTMLIWLGKQWLGQAEKQEITGRNGEPFKSEIVIFKIPDNNRT